MDYECCTCGGVFVSDADKPRCEICKSRAVIDAPSNITACVWARIDAYRKRCKPKSIQAAQDVLNMFPILAYTSRLMQVDSAMDEGIIEIGKDSLLRYVTDASDIDDGVIVIGDNPWGSCAAREAAREQAIVRAWGSKKALEDARAKADKMWDAALKQHQDQVWQKSGHAAEQARMESVYSNDDDLRDRQNRIFEKMREESDNAVENDWYEVWEDWWSRDALELAGREPKRNAGPPAARPVSREFVEEIEAERMGMLAEFLIPTESDLVELKDKFRNSITDKSIADCLDAIKSGRMQEFTRDIMGKHMEYFDSGFGGRYFEAVSDAELDEALKSALGTKMESIKAKPDAVHATSIIAACCDVVVDTGFTSLLESTLGLAFLGMGVRDGNLMVGQPTGEIKVRIKDNKIKVTHAGVTYEIAGGRLVQKESGDLGA